MEQDNNKEELSTTLIGEMLLFGLLGKVLYAQPDKSWLQSLIDEDVFAEVPFGGEQPDVVRGLELLAQWSAGSREGISDDTFLDLRADYTSLFVGTGRVLAPLWESVYFSEARMVFQEETIQVRKWYRRFNLEPEKLNAEPDDHIGLEIAFVSHLANLALQALDQGDDARLEELLAAQRQFMSEHLLRWGPSFCDLVEKHAKTDFYRGLARLTLGALRASAAWLEVEIPAVLPK
jgi:TorA maturation chaperone TorD